MKEIKTGHPFNKPIKVYTKEDARAKADTWRRYRRDIFFRFIEKPLEFILSLNIFNEGFETFAVSMCYLGATAILIAFHLKLK